MPKAKAIFFYVCYHCDYHFELDVADRIEELGTIPQFVNCPHCEYFAERPE